MRSWILVLAVFLVACQQDPYSGKPDVSTTPPKGGPVDKPDPQPNGTFALEVPDLMNFVEGQRNDYALKVEVPKPGAPRVVVQGLPPGMTYDSVAQKLTWTPDFQAANDPANPGLGTRNFVVQVQLFSTTDKIQSLTKRSVVVVTDTPQPKNLKTSPEASASEGRELSHFIEWEDKDFPTGPFEANITGLPVGYRIEWPNKSIPRFRLVWTPPPGTVKNKSSDQISGSVILFSPRGKILDFTIRWNIINVAMPPIASGPTNISQTGDVDFVLMAEDPNVEANPQWSIQNKPSDGTFVIANSVIASGPNGEPRVLALISWKQIPKERIGTVIELQMQACVQGACVPYPVKVTLNAPTARGGR